MKRNNFDLLRLLASLQVLHFHFVTHLRIGSGNVGWIEYIFSNVHGVPVFFVVSGFLISGSFERSRTLSSFAWRRVLRIYPALWMSFAVTLVLLLLFGQLHKEVLGVWFVVWLLSQVTVAQFYHPEPFRHFGIGVVNGSLWSIPVELGFYALTPALYLTVVRKYGTRLSNAILTFMFLLSFALAVWAMRHTTHESSVATKLVSVTPAPHLHMFLLGLMARRNLEAIKPLIVGKLAHWTVILVGALVAQRVGGYEDAAWMILAARVATAFWALSFAFTGATFGAKVLRGNDVSYGIYIYHGLVLNAMVELGLTGTWASYGVSLAATLLLACLSWSLLERPLLALKGRDPVYGRHESEQVRQ